MAKKEEPFYKNGLNFSCQRCSFCCGHSPGFVYLSERDLKALCDFLKMTLLQFVKTYCRYVDYYYGETVIALREKKNYDCILWNNGCTAYEGRPIQCSTYPFWSWMIKDKTTWNECAAECPGMNKGTLHLIEEIEQNRLQYDQNKPLTKEQVEEIISKN